MDVGGHWRLWGGAITALVMMMMMMLTDSAAAWTKLQRRHWTMTWDIFPKLSMFVVTPPPPHTPLPLQRASRPHAATPQSGFDSRSRWIVLMRHNNESSTSLLDVHLPVGPHHARVCTHTIKNGCEIIGFVLALVILLCFYHPWEADINVSALCYRAGVRRTDVTS